MNKSKKDNIRKELYNLKNSINALKELWDKDQETKDLLNYMDGYPFKLSFGEIDVTSWVVGFEKAIADEIKDFPITFATIKYSIGIHAFLEVINEDEDVFFPLKICPTISKIYFITRGQAKELGLIDGDVINYI